jgi:MscS family membrane protein
MIQMPLTVRPLLALLLVSCLALCTDAALAAEDIDLVKPADTSSPRDTLKSFIDSCNEIHRQIRVSHFFDRTVPENFAPVVRLLDCLDTSQLPEFAKEDISAEAAVCLKEILDRIELPPESEIPDTEAIEAAGGYEKLSRWRIPGSRITIARVEDGPRRHEYLFSPGTVERASEYYQQLKGLPYRTTGPETSPGLYRWYFSAPGHPAMAAIVDRLPEWTRERLFGITTWKWAGLIIALPIAMFLMLAIYGIQHRIASSLRGRSVFRYSLTVLLPIFAMLVPWGFKYVMENYFTLRGLPLYVVGFSANLVALAAALVVVFVVSNRIAEIIIASPRIHPQGLDAQLIRIISRLMSLATAVVIFLEGGRYLGIPLTTLLASAGVGGLAVALAAQDTLKALFGTITLMADKPFRVGDRIIFGQYDGVVEDIGLRSTKLRLLTGNQVIMPNDELTSRDVENVGRRRHIRRVANIHIHLDTPREKLEKAVAKIRAILDHHDGMDPDFPPRVFFFDFNPASFGIRVMYWYTPPDYWEYLAFSEKVNFQIFQAFDEQGIQFSLPFRVTHTSIDSQEMPVQVNVIQDHPRS